MTPTWVLDILAALMLVVSAVSAVRLGLARPWQKGRVVTDTDVSHLLMGIAMAGMLVSSLTTLPNSAWEVIFALLTVWFGYRVVRDARRSGVRALAGGHCAPHLVHSASMLYMFLAVGPVAGMAGMAGMTGMSGASGSMEMVRYPTIAFAFTIILVGYAIWDLDQLSGKRYGLTSTRMPGAGIRVTAAAAMAGAEPAAAFSGLAPAGVAAGAAGSAAVSADGQALPVVPGAAGGYAAGAGTSAAGGRVGQFLLSPAVTVGARIVMGVAMAFMLLILI